MNVEDEEVEKLKKEKMKQMMSGETQEEISEPIKLSDRNFQEKVKEHEVMVVDAWAPWCGPCKMMEPVIEELAEKFAGQIVFGKLNVDNNQRTASQFGISGIPTLLVFKNGEVADKMVGASSKAQLEQKLQRFL